MADYYIPGVAACEVRVLQQLCQPVPIWNAFWLSNPTIDTVPEAGSKWWKHYRPVERLLSAIVHDAGEDPRMVDTLTKHPLAFIEWFEQQPHRDFHTYEAAGGEAWVATVLRRATEAADRMILANPFKVSGKVLIFPGPGGR
jgi:hypothetical protein